MLAAAMILNHASANCNFDFYKGISSITWVLILNTQNYDDNAVPCCTSLTSLCVGHTQIDGGNGGVLFLTVVRYQLRLFSPSLLYHRY